VVNFAQGELVMAGGYFGLLFYGTLKLPWFVVVPAVLASSCLLGVVLERLVNRPLARADAFTVIVATIAVGLILRNIARLIWTDDLYALPPMLDVSMAVGLGSVMLTSQNLLVLVSTVVLVALLYALFETKAGKAMRAVQQNRNGAQLVGIALPRVFAQTWALSAVLAGAAGFLLAPLVGVSPAMGWIVLKGFVAAVVGGFTSFPGAVLGGFTVGIVENLAGAYISTAAKDIVTYVILIAVLMVWPSGLLGRAEMRRT
jgi:branched-chain amino acid transport system permease protein